MVGLTFGGGGHFVESWTGFIFVLDMIRYICMACSHFYIIANHPGVEMASRNTFPAHDAD